MSRPFARYASLCLMLVVTTLTLAGVARGQPSFGGAGPRATAEVLLNTDRLAPGQQAIAAVVVTIDDGYHAQSSKPLDESLIPFVVTLKTDPAAIHVDDVLYAPGDLQDFPALGGQLSVYHGKRADVRAFRRARGRSSGRCDLHRDRQAPDLQRPDLRPPGDAHRDGQNDDRRGRQARDAARGRLRPVRPDALAARPTGDRDGDGEVGCR